MNFIASSILFFCAQPLLAQSWTAVYQQTQKSIPVIISSGATCSGALIDKRLILTSAHCVDQYRDINVYFKMNEWTRYSARRVQILEASDLALLQLNEEVSLPLIPLLPKGESLQEGQSIVTVGHPLGRMHFKINSLLKSDYLHVISSGLISKIGTNGFISDTSVSPGNSGGPVMNQKGQIIGVVSKKRIDRFSGDLAFFSNHQQIHQVIENNISKKPHSESLLNAKSSADLYVTYSQPNFRKNREGDAKTYWNLGIGILIWDRLRLTMDTNLDTKEAFTQYGLGWSYHLQAQDPLVHYKLTPAIEFIKFRFRNEAQDSTTIEKFAPAVSLTFKPSWFPFFIKASGFRIDQKDYSLVGLGLLF